MSDSCQNQTDQRSHAEDGKSELSSEFSSSAELQHSCMEDKEHLQVYLRIRPLTSAESSSGESQDCVTIETPETVLLKPPSLSFLTQLSSDKSLPQTGQRFQFSKVYGPETTQSKLFEGTVKDLVKDVLEGGNSLVFTYGVTNSGKTFTFLGPDSEAGILPRSLHVIFSSIQEDVLQGLSVKPHRCREFLALSLEQQAEEALFKKNLLKQLRENEKSSTTLLNTTNQTWLEGSAVTGPGAAAEDKISLEVKPNTKFSVWVSFCEIYNENIHDLLEVAPNGAPRRAALRLAQDAKGNAFVKDLRWVQVSSAEEAYAVVKLGRRNQSFSSTRLNQLSSRSHSIFSIRILRVEDSDPARVHTISELCLCDLAGSERCAKTQNKGERLKEAGNINTSLLILGKCIKALRYNQQAKLLQHVPFRESKLTHYLQGFFCGRGRACMIVNINQCASMYDETLNVLKFSAVAQKVVVLISRPLPAIPSCSDSSSIRTTGRKTPMSSGGGSLTGWETSLEDVQEDEEEESFMDQTADGEEDDEIIINKRTHERQVALLRQLQLQLKKERSENLLLEARVREEISREFSELFSDMQKDYDERLARERELLEERAERRLEIFKNLTKNMSSAGSSSDRHTTVTPSVSLGSGRAVGSISIHFSLVFFLFQDTFLNSELAGVAPICPGSSHTEEKSKKEAEDDQNHEHKAGESEDEERKRLLLQFQEKALQVAWLEQQVKDLQKKRELGTQMDSEQDKDEDQLQEALAALHKEKTKREELLAALEYQTLGKEEALAALREERRSREELLASLEEERRANQEARAQLEQEKRSRGEARPAAAELEKSRQLLDQSHQIHILTHEVQRLKQELQTSEGVSHQLREEASELRKSLDETKQRRIQELEEAQQTEAALEQQVGELKKKLEAQEELRVQLESQRETSKQEAEQLRAELREQQAAAEKLRDELKEAQLSGAAVSASAEDLQKMSSDLQSEITSLKEQLSGLEAVKESFSEKEQTRREKEQQMEEKLAEMERRSAQREAELQEKLQEAERQVASLQERREEEERQAAQEARSREAERRRELLAVAHEAIDEKDSELEKKAEEISRLKQDAQREAEQLKSLRLELQRKEDDSSDLREKLADYRKQVQQVHKEISALREEEKVLKQKLADADRAKKQLQSDLGSRDRTIQHLRAEQQDSKADQLYQKACKELEAKQQVMEGMRLALTEQEETQVQMEKVLEEKTSLLQELSAEVEKLKGKLLQQNHGADGPSEDLKLARDEASEAQKSLKVFTEKHQAERRKWQEEKLSLIGQAKEAEDKRNQEMRKFAEDRERYCRQQSLLESKLVEKEAAMESWRKERDTLVAALEVQLQKLLSSQAEKEKLIRELQQQSAKTPPETQQNVSPAVLAENSKVESLKPERRETRSSASSQGSSGFPSVLESSEISTENGRTSRFPRPELEISFSPLQPNRMALRRQGEESAVTVKIARTGRKRKSEEMGKSHIFRRTKRRTTRQEEVETENRRNTRSKLTPKLTPQTEESSSSAHCQDSQSSIRSGKDRTLQKIGHFLQKSPTLLGSKAKKMMSLVSSRLEADSAAAAAASASSSASSSLNVGPKRGRKKLHRPDISCPMEMPPHPIINQEMDDSESDHQLIKRRLRSRVAKH
ncbi:kinesin-like protein KIF20B [Anableps anableps]